MKITFLGTGTSQGIPILGCDCAVCSSTDEKDKRLRSSIMLQDKGLTIIIDTGPDFRQQMLREKVKKVDAVVFTHEHKDHLAGLDDVRPYNFLHRMVMPVYATERVQEAIKREFHYVFSGEKYPGIPQLELTTIHPQATFNIGDIEFIPIEVMHAQMPVLGFRVGNFTYITDANHIAEPEKEKIRGSEILVLNALRREPHISHFTLEEAIELIKELKPKKAYLTHISHQLGKHEEISKELPDFIELAYDGLVLNC